MTHLPNSNIQDGNLIDLVNAWIVWTVNKDFKVNDVQVYEWDREKSPNNPMSDVLEKSDLIYKDIGASLMNWPKWSTADVMYYFLQYCEFESEDVKILLVDALTKISEFKELVNKSPWALGSDLD